MKHGYVLIPVILVLFLAGCADETYYCWDGTEVSDLADCAPQPVPKVEPEPGPEQVPELVQESEEPVVVLAEEAADLQEKARETDNYQFSYAVLPDNKAQRTYFVRGDQARVELFKPMIREADSYDTVYLDLANKRAVAYCEEDNNVICSNKTKIMDRPDYADYSIEMPRDLMLDIEYADYTGSITYESHTAAVFEYEKNGKFYQMVVQKYFGIPMRLYWYDNENLEGEPMGYEFRDLAFNSVTEAMVTPPSGW